MPNWWFRLPKGIRIGIVVIVLWQLLAFLSALIVALGHPYP